MAVVSVRVPSDAPKLVCRRSNDPKTRRLFDSSEALDVIEPVLEIDDVRMGSVVVTKKALGIFVLKFY